MDMVASNISTLFVGLIILATGIMALIESIPKILHPELADYSWATITVVVAAIILQNSFSAGMFVALANVSPQVAWLRLALMRCLMPFFPLLL